MSRIPRPALLAARIAVTALCTAALVSCGGPPKPPSLDRLYRGLSESLPPISPSILEGRRVLIDPGHGGQFRGTVGRDSLEEAAVNLGVSLYLWGLLRESGADAYLTRAIDRDFLTAADSSLASDLRRRVSMADTLEPDVLVSIHHNAHPGRDPETNSVETYYRAGDPASLDLAFAIHRHLMRNLGIERGEVRQGNYMILRESRVPAVLGESSYLTHPNVEDKLKLSEVQKLEAEAYFLGILEYFQRGIPRVALVSPIDSLHESVPELVYSMEDDGGPGIDPDGLVLTLNGRPVTPFVDPLARRAAYTPPWDLPNGTYEARFSARNVGGNTSAELTNRFAVDFPPEFASFDLSPPLAPPKGRAMRARVRLLDRRGLPIADGTEAYVTTSTARDTAWTEVVGGAIDAVVATPESKNPLTVYAGCRGRRFQHTVEQNPNANVSTRACRIADAVTGLPVEGALVTQSGHASARASHTGSFVYEGGAAPGVAGSTNATLSITAPGYIPVVLNGAAPPDAIELTPWFEGALTGRRFVIDPEGGRAAKTGIGPLGLSGAHANLQVARYLSGYLRAAGSRVLLTRINDEVRTPEDIARMTNAFAADRYVEIRHRSAPADSPLVVTVYHFPGSVAGSRMAVDLSTAISARLGVPARGPFDTVTYPLQQTACPAVVVAAPSIGTLEEELRLAESWYQREQAYAIFLGILDHYLADDGGQVVVRVAGTAPPPAPDDGVDRAEAAAGDRGASGWRVTLEGTWTLVTGPDGTVVFDNVPPGRYRVDAVRSGRLLGDTVNLDTGGRAAVIFEPGLDAPDRR